MSKSAPSMTQFFKLLTAKRFTEAERSIHQLRQDMQKNEWNRGYIQALNGMLLTMKSNNDQYMFLSNINFDNTTQLKKHRLEFSKYAKDELQVDYDRGFFSAWVEYLSFLLK